MTIVNVYNTVKSVIPASSTYKDSKVSAMEMISGADGGRSSTFNDEIGLGLIPGPMDNNIEEMLEVIQNEQRSKLFKAMADRLMISENVLFLEEVLKLQQSYVDILGKMRAFLFSQ